MANDYLMHHGVKGMKWGVRHDPKPYGKRFVKSDGSLTRRGKRKQNRIDQTINRVRQRDADADRRLADYKRRSKLVNNPKNKQKVTNEAMRDFYGDDYNKKKYLEELEERPYSELQKEAYNHYKKMYSPSVNTNLNNYKKSTQSYLSKYGNTKIQDMKTKEEYKKFVNGYTLQIGKDTYRFR